MGPRINISYCCQVAPVEEAWGSQPWSNFWIWPLYKLSCDPQASCTGYDPAALWNIDPWFNTNIIKLSNPLFLFSWLNFASVRPISIESRAVGLWMIECMGWLCVREVILVVKSQNMTDYTISCVGCTPLNTAPILTCVKAYSKNRHFRAFIMIKIGQTRVFLNDYVHIHQMKTILWVVLARFFANWARN